RIVAFRRAFSPQRLNTIRIAVETTTNSVSVKTSGPPRPRWGFGDRSGTVDYVVTVPQRARVAEIDVPSGEILIDGLRGPAIAASLGSGRITIHNCFCDQDIRVKEGGVDFFFDWVEDKPITLQGALETGNMRAVIPADASFRLHAVAEKGHVVSDFTEPEKRSRHGFSEIDESVGSFPQAQVR